MTARAYSHQIEQGIFVTERPVMQVVNLKAIFRAFAFADHATMGVDLEAFSTLAFPLRGCDVLFPVDHAAPYPAIVLG